MSRVAVVVLVVVLAAAAPAIATMGDSATSASTVTTSSLAAPTALTATAGCNGLLPKVTLGWTATATTYATGYDVYRAVGAGPSTLLASVSPRTTVSYVDTAVAVLTSYTYTVRTRFQSWTKASSTASATTPALCL